MPKRRIFLAEDSSSDAFLFEQSLKAAGCEYALTHVKDGAQACQALTAAAPGEYDLVVIDLNLPKQNGEAVLAAIQKSDLGAYFPIVVLTTSDSAAEKERARILGARHYFVKPLRLAEFYEIGRSIRRILEHSQSLPPN